MSLIDEFQLGLSGTSAIATTHTAGRPVGRREQDMDRAINRNAAMVLAITFAFLLWGFWPNYFAILSSDINWRFHFHGMTLIAWCVLMVTQAYLIRTNQRPLHRATGKISYLLVPLVLISTVLLSHHQEQPREIVFATFGVAITFTLLMQFLFAYSLAIYNRHKPLIHARFMICTALPMIPPIYDRIIGIYIFPLERFPNQPTIGGGTVPIISYIFVDLVLIALSVWDWRSRRKLNVFPVVLVAFVLFQIPTYVAHRFESLRNFADWFRNLPLS